MEAGRPASLAIYARLAAALGLALDLSLGGRHERTRPGSSDLVHAAMGELEFRLLGPHRYDLAVDHPYQHYQFAGRADVLARSHDAAALLHLENRTRFPDLQQAAGSYNAKRRYLAGSLARELGIRRFESQTHVMVALWSAEVIYAVRLRGATFRAICPDPPDRLSAWLEGSPAASGQSSSFVLLDPLATGRQARWVGLEQVTAGVRPRVRGYREAAGRLR